MTQQTMFPVGMSDTLPPPLDEVDFEGFRQSLARLVDDRIEVGKTLESWGMTLSVKFVATLAALYGHKDKMRKWTRISDGLAAARAKTIGPDVDAFVSLVLEFINANAGIAASSCRIRDVLEKLTGRDGANDEEKQLWIDNLCAKRFVILSRAKAEWEKYLADKRAKVDVSWWSEDADFDAYLEAAEQEEEPNA